jgi:hypothetical protein
MNVAASGRNVGAARLTLRLHRLELVALGGVLVALAAAAFMVAGWLDAIGYGPSCIDPTGTQPVSVSCEALSRRFYDLQGSLASPIAGLLVTLAYGAAALLGVAVVGRELERGTSRLAWSIAPSRRRWYLGRLVPVLVALAAITFLAGIATDRLAAASAPGVDVTRAFDGFGSRGGLVASRAILVFAIAVATGTMLGRVLPALMLAAVLSWASLSYGSQIHDRILLGEAVAVPADQDQRGARFFDQRFRLPDGQLVGWEVMQQLDPPPPDGEWIPKYPMVNLVVPGERYRAVEAREAAALGAGTLVWLGFAGLVVSRRRPG